MLKRLDPSDAGVIAIGPSRERPWFSFEAVASLLPLIDILIVLAASVVGAISYLWLSTKAPILLSRRLVISPPGSRWEC